MNDGSVQRLDEHSRSLRPSGWSSAAKSAMPLLIGIGLAFMLQKLLLPYAIEHGLTYYSRQLFDIGIAIILAASLNIVNGFTGQFSMGHAGFLAVGGYVSAMFSYYGSIKMYGAATMLGGSLSTLNPKAAELLGSGDWLFVGSLLAGGAAAALVGLAVGLPSLRLKGDYLAIVTLGFGEIVRVLVQQTNAVLKPVRVDWERIYPSLPKPEGAEKIVAFTLERADPVTGALSPQLVPVSEVPWWEVATHLGGALGFTGIPTYSGLFWVYVWVTITLVTAFRLKTSTFGRAFLSIREDEIAAESMGVNTTRYKVMAFVIAAFFAGIAGGLLAHTLGVGLSAESAGFQKSFDIIIMVVLGGLGSISGAAFAAAVVTVLPEALRSVADYRLIIYALALILIMIFRPKGLLGVNEIWDRAAWPEWLLRRLGLGRRK